MPELGTKTKCIFLTMNHDSTHSFPRDWGDGTGTATRRGLSSGTEPALTSGFKLEVWVWVGQQGSQRRLPKIL